MSAGFIRKLWRSSVKPPSRQPLEAAPAHQLLSIHPCGPQCLICTIKRDLLSELAIVGSFAIDPGPGDEPPRISNPAYRAIAEMVVEGLIRDDGATLVITRKGCEAAA